MDEYKLIEQFLKKNHKDRINVLLKSEKGRKKFITSLSHTFIDKINDSNKFKLIGTYNEILKEAKKYFGKTCYIISESSFYDKKEISLDEIFPNVIRQNVGSLLCRMDGKVIFYQGEDLNSSYIIKI
jgi:hypothetical protein